MYFKGLSKNKTKQKLTNQRRALFLMALSLLLLPLSASEPFRANIANAEAVDASIIIDEYAISLKGKVSPGKYTLPVKNVGTMLHEVVVFKLKGETTADDFKSIISSGGSLRKVGKMKGNMQAIKPGASGTVTSTFEAGNYLLLCFQVDMKTGNPHFMIGMLHEFTVA